MAQNCRDIVEVWKMTFLSQIGGGMQICDHAIFV